MTSDRHVGQVQPTLKVTHGSRLEHRNLSTSELVLPPARKQQPGEGNSRSRNITTWTLKCPVLSTHKTCREQGAVTHRLQATGPNRMQLWNSVTLSKRLLHSLGAKETMFEQLNYNDSDLIISLIKDKITRKNKKLC